VLYIINKLILPEKYQTQNQVYGLINYIKSLTRLVTFSSKSLSAFPAHRLFYNGHYNLINDTSQRSRDIIQFHIDRCLAIIKIIGPSAVSVKDIAARHFMQFQLQGIGKNMAIDEISAHLEFMEECDDINFIGEERKLVKWKGTTKHIAVIEAYLNSCQQK